MAAYMYAQGNPFNLQGVYIIDGLITDIALLNDIPTYDFAVQNRKALNFSNSDLATIKEISDQCGFADFVEKNLFYPSKGPMEYDRDEVACNGTYPYDVFVQLANDRNPCFDLYYIAQTCPSPVNVLGDVNDPNVTVTFFDNPSLQDTMHAPHQKWNVCAKSSVFPNGDDSDVPDKTGTLRATIENSRRTVIVNGDMDGRIFTNGTALAIQNLVWNNKRGFLKPPTSPLIGTTGETTGRWVSERSLTYVEHFRAGHKVPSYDQGGSLKTVLFLLGRVPSLDA